MKYKILLLLFIYLIHGAQAQQMIEFDNYQLHYIVLNTTELTPEIAQQYKIMRSKKRAFINLSLLEKKMSQLSPVEATLKVTQRSLIGQIENIPLTMIKEGHSIYYIGDFRIFDKETLWFDIDITLPNNEKHQFRFSQQVWHES